MLEAFTGVAKSLDEMRTAKLRWLCKTTRRLFDLSNRPRDDWDQQFKQMAERGDDWLLDAEAASLAEWDADEWEWAQNACTHGEQSALGQATGAG